MAVLRIVSPDELTRQDAETDAARVAAEDKLQQDNTLASSLVAYIDNELSRYVRHRDGGSGWSDRLVAAMRTFKGEYSSSKLAEIRKFGGSDIFARLSATKCRGATSLLRDVYLNTDKPWGLEPTPDPVLPDDVVNDVLNLVMVESNTMTRLGQPPTPDMIKDRVKTLMVAAKKAAIKTAKSEAEKSFDKLDDLLTEGGFYEALGSFLVDLPLFPFAVLKGPVVRIQPEVTWVQGRAVQQNKPRMMWNRVSPFDVWWTPGVSNIADATVIERTRVTRSDLNQLLGLPGYNDAAIKEVLRWYGQSGYVEINASTSDTARAQMESREDPRMNESGLIDMIELHGYVQGRMLLDQGFSPEQVPDPMADYFVDVFKIGRYVIKVQLSPSLRKRPPYYITSFEKVPGTVVGNGLPDILEDVQDAANAALRSLINNMAIASGPQVVVNDDRVADNEDSDELYPWKRWHTVNDPMSSGQLDPIKFFQPQSNAQELLGVYEKFTQIADDLSAIPRYITGSDRMGGAGRTASGLAMLMGNAAKILQTVASNIDGDVIEPVVTELYDMVMLTDETGMLRGDESIVVLGVNVAMQRETQRQRQLEFLQITANPIDTQITGIRGRANVLRSVADGIGLEGDEVVPSDDEIRLQMAGPPGGAPGAPAPGGGPGAPQGTPGNQAPEPGPMAPPQTNVTSAPAATTAG